jgi:cyclophilin family peptidyl-prolyl cis-trans isomerase
MVNNNNVLKVAFYLIMTVFVSSCFLTKNKKQKTRAELVLIETTHGNIKVRLYDQTPIHKANFLSLVDSGFYNGLLFHRVIPKFMAQSGDPDSRNAKPDKNLGNGGPGYTLGAENVDSLIHKKGALSAARLGNDVNPEKRSSGSQFYIVQGRVFKEHEMDLVAENSLQSQKMTELQKYIYAPENEKILKQIQYYQAARMSYRYDSIIRSLDPIILERIGPNAKPTFTDKQIQAYTQQGGAPHLDGGYTVFGEVIEGLDVLDSICGAERNNYDRPKKDIIILKASRVKK